MSFTKVTRVVHWTLTTFDREKGWLSETLHQQFRELMLHTASREGLFCPVYCMMPDHIHLVWMGLRFDSDQLNGMAFLRTHLEPLLRPTKFQPQAHDHVLSEHERQRNAFAKVCLYDLRNPVDAELVTDLAEWKFHGAIVPGYPTLHPSQEDFWSKFWKLYTAAKHPDSGTRKLPPRGL